MTETNDTWPAGATATMTVTYQQGNAAGGAVVCEITPTAGNEFLVFAGKGSNGGTNAVQMALESGLAGNIVQLYTNVASGAQTIGFLGGVSTGVPATLAVPYPGIMVSGTQAFVVKQTGAGAQNDLFTVILNIRVKTGTMPTVTHANSTNPANVTVTGGAESFTAV